MKRHLLFLLFCLSLLAFAGCSKTGQTLPQEATTRSEEEITREILEAGLNTDGTLKDYKSSDLIKKLATYKGLKIPRDEVRVSEKDVEEQVKTILTEYTEVKKIKNRKIKKGDIVHLSYNIRVDGELIPEERVRDRDIVIGSGAFETLEQGIIGKKPRKKRYSVDYTMPDPYENNPSLSGKDVVLRVKIKYILETKEPKLNDKFVRENMEETYHVSTVKEWKAALRKKMRRERKGQYVMTVLMKRTKFEGLPHELVDDCVNRYVLQVKNTAKANGISFQDYLKQAHYANEEAMRKTVRSMCREEARICLMVDEIASKEKISVTEQDLEDYFAVGDVTLDKLREFYPDPYLYRQALNLKVRDYVIDQSVEKK